MIVPGKHNIYNALAAAATAHYLGATPKEIAENLHKFGGVHRRFEILGTPEGITVADDFAHHPTELTATLNAAMNMGFKKYGRFSSRILSQEQHFFLMILQRLLRFLMLQLFRKFSL